MAYPICSCCLDAGVEMIMERVEVTEAVSAVLGVVLLGAGFSMDLPFLRECFDLEDDFLTVMVFLEEGGFVLPIFR